MSVHVISSVLDCEDEQLNPTRRMILIVLANFAGDDWSCWPTQGRIASQAGCKERQVREHLKWLDEEGFISRSTKRLGQGNGSRTSYKIHHERLRTSTDSGGQHKTAQDNVRPADIAATNRPAEYRNYTGEITPITNRQEPSLDNTDVLSAHAEKEIPKNRKRKAAPRGAGRRSRIDPNWTPNPKDYAFATSRGLTPQEINHEAEQFRNHHSAKGTLFSDWSAGWRTWAGNAAKWKSERRSVQPASNRGRATGFAAFADELEGAGRGPVTGSGYDADADQGFIIDAEPTFATGTRG